MKLRDLVAVPDNMKMGIPRGLKLPIIWISKDGETVAAASKRNAKGKRQVYLVQVTDK